MMIWFFAVMMVLVLSLLLVIGIVVAQTDQALRDYEDELRR